MLYFVLISVQIAKQSTNVQLRVANDLANKTLSLTKILA